MLRRYQVSSMPGCWAMRGPELLSGEQQAGAHKRARPDACASLHAGLVTLSVGLVMGALVGLLLLLLRRQLGHAFTDDPAVLAVSRLP